MNALAPALKYAPVVAPWLVLASAVAILLKAWQPFAALKQARELGETARLSARVEALEGMVERLHAKIDQERAEYDAMMSIMRHRVNNSRMALKSIVMMLRVNPDKVTEALGQIESMMVEQEAAEREEKAALDLSRMTAAAVKEGTIA